MRRKALTGSAAILWGACMLIVGLINLRAPAYGADFLHMMSSLYPGFHDSRTLWDVIVGTLYGLVDGAIAGYVFSTLYRWFSGPGSEETIRLSPGSGDPTVLRRAS